MIRRLAAVAAAVALLAVPLAAPARADTITPTPGEPVSLRPTSSNVLLVFYRHPDGDVRLQTRSGAFAGGVGGTSLLGGSVSTAPTGMVRGTGEGTRYWVVAAGTNGAVYYRNSETWPPQSQWTPWTSLGGSTTDPPAIGCTSENGPPAVYVRGRDGALWMKGVGNAAPWASIGGSMLTGPATVPTNDGDCSAGGVLDLVTIGADSAVWRWRGTWSRIGGSSALTPSLVRYGDTDYAFVVGTNGALYWSHRAEGYRWSKFTKIGGTFTTAPSAVVWSEKPPYDEVGLTVAALGANGKLYRATRSLTDPGAWTIEAG